MATTTGSGGEASEDEQLEFLASAVEEELHVSADVDPQTTETETETETVDDAKQGSTSNQSTRNASSIANLLQNLVRSKDVQAILDVQEEALRKVRKASRSLEQYNTKAEGLLADEVLGAKLNKQMARLVAMTQKMEDIAVRVKKLNRLVELEMK